jgi:hypothetical protein
MPHTCAETIIVPKATLLSESSDPVLHTSVITAPPTASRIPAALINVNFSSFINIDMTVAMHGILGWKMANRVAEIYRSESIAPTTLIKENTPKQINRLKSDLSIFISKL